MSAVSIFTDIATGIWDTVVEATSDLDPRLIQDRDTQKRQGIALSEYEKSLERQARTEEKKEKRFQIFAIAGLALISYYSLKGK